MPKKTIFLIAGEASGDLHGSRLVKELKGLGEYEFYGLGGKAMEHEGVRIFFDLPSIAALGLGDVLKQYLLFRKIFYQTLDHVFNEIKPDVIILIDYPGFNIRFAKKINKRIPVVYYISPQVWAWGKRRIKTIARVVNRMLVLLPFEVGVYKGSGLDCRFVGHPLIDLVRPSKSEAEIRKEWGLGDKKIIGLLPGSRKHEVSRILPVMLDAAALLKKKYPEYSFVLTETPSLPQALYDEILAKHPAEIIRIKNRSYDALAVMEFAMVASGTATLETAISMKPFVIVYKTAASTYFLGKRLIQIPYIGLVNVLAGEKIVPEFIQQDATGKNIAAECEKFIADPAARAAMLEAIGKVRNSLGAPGASRRAAGEIFDLLKAGGN